MQLGGEAGGRELVLQSTWPFPSFVLHLPVLHAPSRRPCHASAATSPSRLPFFVQRFVLSLYFSFVASVDNSIDTSEARRQRRISDFCDRHSVQ